MKKSVQLMVWMILAAMPLVFAGCGEDEAEDDPSVKKTLSALTAEVEQPKVERPAGDAAQPRAEAPAEDAVQPKLQDAADNSTEAVKKPAKEQTPDKETILREIRAEAEQMSIAELRTAAEQYKKAIATRKVEQQQLVAELRELGPAAFSGPNAKDIQAKMGRLNRDINALVEPLAIYYNKLAEKGGDVSGLAP